MADQLADNTSGISLRFKRQWDVSPISSVARTCYCGFSVSVTGIDASARAMAQFDAHDCPYRSAEHVLTVLPQHQR